VRLSLASPKQRGRPALAAAVTHAALDVLFLFLIGRWLPAVFAKNFAPIETVLLQKTKLGENRIQILPELRFENRWPFAIKLQPVA